MRSARRPLRAADRSRSRWSSRRSRPAPPRRLVTGDQPDPGAEQAGEAHHLPALPGRGEAADGRHAVALEGEADARRHAPDVGDPARAGQCQAEGGATERGRRRARPWAPVNPTCTHVSIGRSPGASLRDSLPARPAGWGTWPTRPPPTATTTRRGCVPRHRAERTPAARPLARTVAELRHRPPRRDPARHPARAFDRGVTHFDLANKYGPPYGRAEENLDHFLDDDFAPYRDELVISTKAGYDMWPGPYGQGDGSRKYVLASLDQSLARLGSTTSTSSTATASTPRRPLEETMAALDTAVRSGRALYAGVSSTPPRGPRGREHRPRARTLLLIHQPSYSMLNR